MTRKILLVTIFAILAYGFWVSPDFKTIAASAPQGYYIEQRYVF